MKGTMEELEIVRATECSYIVVSVKVTEVLDGDAQVGTVYDIWIPADVDNDPTAKEYLSMLEEGMKDNAEYIFTPYIGAEDGRFIAYRKD